jgi:hypothetical protein
MMRIAGNALIRTAAPVVAEVQASHEAKTSSMTSAEMPTGDYGQAFPMSYRHWVRRALSGETGSVPATDSAYAEGLPAGARYWRDLADVMGAWVDSDRVTRWRDSPLMLLRLVCDHAGVRIPAAFLAEPAPEKLEDEAWLDQAALLYRYTHRHAHIGTSEAAGGGLSLRRVYLEALRRELESLKTLAGALAPPPGATGSDRVYFDGFSLQNAKGKSFDEIVLLPQFVAIPGFARLTPIQRLALLRDSFLSIGEDTQYRVGTVQHSLASTVMRIRAYRHLPPLPARPDEQAWAQAFIELESQWAQTKHYPLHPRILFAMHLAASSQAEQVEHDWRERLWAEVLPGLPTSSAGQGLPRALESGPADVKGFATRQLARLRAELQPLPDNEAQIQRQVLTRLFDELADGTLGRIRAPTHIQSVPQRAQYAFRVNRWREKLIPLQQAFLPHLKQEKIAGVGWGGKLQALVAYASERLQANFETAPEPFSRENAAAECLRSRGVSEAALRQRRHYTITGSNINLNDNRFGTPVEEFLARADWVGLIGREMRVAGQSVDPRALLQLAEEQYNQGLKTDRWVLARARENLRLSGQPVSAGAVRTEVDRIVSRFATETEAHRGWVRGLETWISTVPVLGPAFNVEEGIRHQDPWQAVLGVIFLGLDALDMFSGGQPGEALSPEVDVSGSASMSEPVPNSERVPLLDARGRQAIAVRQHVIKSFGADAPESRQWITRRADDPFGVKRETAPAPSRTYANRSFEVDGAEVVRGVPVAERLTCSSVKALIENATDFVVRDFDDLFARRFRLELHGDLPSAFDAQAFYRSLYLESPSFRRLFNRFAATAPADEVWRIHIGDTSKPAGTYTHQTGKAIYIQRDDALSGLHYMSAEGLAPMQIEQAYLHEMLHAITGAADPEPFLDLLNRGPVVYLTDRVLAETGRSMPQQVMYRRKDAPQGRALHESIEGNRAAAAEAMEIENRYLDRLLDRQGPAGVHSVWARNAINSIVERIKTPGVPGVTPGVDQRFVAAQGAALPHLLHRLEERSPTFLRLLEAGSEPSVPWHIEWEDNGPGRVDRSRKAIVLGKHDGRYYLSERGVEALEAVRLQCELLVEALGAFDRLSGPEARSRRGAVVMLADSILNEAGYHFPHRLSAAASGEAGRPALAVWRTPATRRARFEDFAFADAMEANTRLATNRVD